MLARFVCLANSYKEGGRCLAGIMLDEQFEPIFENGRPKWIRPLSNSEHGEVPTFLAQYFKIRDIINVMVTGYPEKLNYQSENAFFREHTLDKIGRFEKDKLESLCENKDFIFGNSNKALNQEGIRNLNYSLMLVRTAQFEVHKRADEYNDETQIRLKFEYRGNIYDLPVTDPVFLHYYEKRKNYLESTKNLILCLSLGIEWNGWYYKLVAGVVRFEE